ncbi:GNAT family N-acetyltransferase [Streptomyces sp. CHA1]|uniref:GNAT family N-acetyltransferase n=1 Tax=Actinomycetes TaxID=1760 RepID=UPI0003C3100D|nr:MULTISPECIES: GNAT family N-acetyltransferase [Streptomyces]QPA00773.1 GNAT family N-acetyltransferase [Streptomyces violascens]WDV32565.1 GNAT family N-acetyltransferase [Streptomyces sp. AD16]ESP98490.1 Histone acetyltransferase HPA2-related acetyltransferase [Streptomyces sp. GBA 94-10 4N24]ESQ04131.1 Histone acetyltransferase HPA2-related acetyltransferase [Streptomyces sp. PVA_94-07]MBP3079129.1 GCN5 family acetyltransferase [Streptomyces sp. 604F]
MNIIDLAPGDPRLTTDALPVLAELRPHLTARLLEEVYAAGHPQGLRFSALYDTEGRCVAVAGWRVIANTSAIRKLYVDDLVTAEAARSTGAGRELVAYLEDRARELDCRVLDLDSGTQRTDAHRFYLRERFSIRAFHFSKLLR